MLLHESLEARGKQHLPVSALGNPELVLNKKARGFHLNQPAIEYPDKPRFSKNDPTSSGSLPS
jgi:hypothetical protein